MVQYKFSQLYAEYPYLYVRSLRQGWRIRRVHHPAISIFFLFSHFLPLLLDDATRMHNGIPTLAAANA